jgi:hypothetical protein
MDQRLDYVEIAKQFSVTVRRFCKIVESAPTLEKNQLLVQIYQILPELIGQAIHLPDVELSDEEDPNRVDSRGFHEQWKELFDLLQEKLGDADLYWQLLDPTMDSKTGAGLLADDLADIYGNLKEGLVLLEGPEGSPREAIWHWRLLFYSHWGQHAIDALRIIHFHLHDKFIDHERQADL